MKTFFKAFLLTLSIVWLSASSAFALPKILILGAEQSAWCADIATKLTNTGQFAGVDYQVIPTAGGSLPTLSQLQGYGSVMVFSDYGVGAGLGTILAQYADGGGGVVVGMFCLGNGINIDASFDNATYNVITPGSYTTGTVTLGSVGMPSHPIMKNITSINGGISFRTTSTSLNGSAYVIASWSDGNILVAAREKVGANSKARRVDLNMFPVSADAYSSGWITSTQGALLMANCMTWAAGGGAPPSELNLTPRAINFGAVPPSSPVTSCVTANSVGLSTLHITGISMTGVSDFTISSGPNVGDSILVGSSKNFCITFNPTAAGTRTATFTLKTDGADSGTQAVALTGNGVIPAVTYGATTMFHSVFTELTDTSNTQYLTVSSTGLGPLVFSSIYFYGLNANNYIIVHTPPNPLLPGHTDSIGIRFVPTIEGRPDANLVINTNTINLPSDTIPMYGDGVLPRLVINNTYSSKTTTGPPSTGTTITNSLNVSFGSINVGHDSCMEVTLVNPGSDTLAIEKNFFSSADYDFTMTPLTGSDTLILPGGGSQQIQVCFTPLKQGTRNATMRITTNIPHTFDSPPHDTSGFSINITGIGIAVGHLAITGPAEDSTPVGVQKCTTLMDTLWNTGSSTTTVTGAAITGTDSAAFTYSGLTFPVTLAPNAYVAFTICGNPKVEGNNTALFTANDADNSAGLPLSIFGTNLCDTLAWVTPFESATCMGTMDTATISVTNCGNIPTSYLASISGTNASQFTIVSANPSSSENAGGVATFKVSYTPDATDASSTATFNITGGPGGTLPLVAVHSSAVIAGSGAAPTTAVGVTSAAFPVTVTNTGACPWDPGAPSGITAGPFTYSSGAAVIPAGGNIIMQFTYTPTSSAAVSQQVTFAGASATLTAPNVTITASSESVSMISAKNGYSIDQSYPNPSTGKSNVEITLPNAGMVHLAILDITGNVVENVLDQQFNEGSYSVKIEANDLASGTYFYSMTSGGVTLTRQMTILK